MECCSICYDVVEHKATLSCKHSFCASCIRQWLEGHRTCPMCRRHVCLMELEEIRIESFEGWDDPPIDAEILAANGFYWIGYADLTRCAFCNLLMVWDSHDCPRTVHNECNPACPLLENREDRRRRLSGGITIILMDLLDF